VLNGTVDRHPRGGIILANAGGFVPYASYRSTELARVFRSDAAKPADCLGPLLAAQTRPNVQRKWGRSDLTELLLAFLVWHTFQLQRLAKYSATGVANKKMMYMGRMSSRGGQ